MHIFQNGSLVIHDVAPEDSGSYTCIAGNSCNIRHTEAPLFVVGMSQGRVPYAGSRILSHLACSVTVYREDMGDLGGLGCPFQYPVPVLDSWLVCHSLDIPSPRFLYLCWLEDTLFLKCLLLLYS